MGSTATIILVGILLGTLQLVAGIVIGRILPVGGRSDAGGPSDPETLRDFLRRLSYLVRAMNDDVGQHRAEIGKANRQLATAQTSRDSCFTEAVLSTVAQVMQVNEKLQDRLVAAEEKLREQTQQIELHVNEARTDPLTGLPNRRALDDELARKLAEWERKNITFCLMLADVDRFKAVNDRYGHPIGDKVLGQLGELLENTARRMDFVARFGGEEFAVILPSTESDAARRAAERFREAIEAHSFHGDSDLLDVTVSVGLTQVGPDDDPVTLLRRADQALYASKRAGRNCSHFHNGHTCERIDADCATTAGPGAENDPYPPELAPGQDPEVESLSQNLRNRLAEVISREPG
jgi:diguanylate cyclase